MKNQKSPAAEITAKSDSPDADSGLLNTNGQPNFLILIYTDFKNHHLSGLIIQAGILFLQDLYNLGLGKRQLTFLRTPWILDTNCLDFYLDVREAREARELFGKKQKTKAAVLPPRFLSDKLASEPECPTTLQGINTMHICNIAILFPTFVIPLYKIKHLCTFPLKLFVLKLGQCNWFWSSILQL